MCVCVCVCVCVALENNCELVTLHHMDLFKCTYAHTCVYICSTHLQKQQMSDTSHATNVADFYKHASFEIQVLFTISLHSFHRVVVYTHSKSAIDILRSFKRAVGVLT